MVFDAVDLFFALGVFARLVRSDLRLPEALYETLSIYLLLAIGLKRMRPAWPRTSARSAW